MNKEQIIKRMNPIQLAKLTGPKTGVADKPLTPDEMGETTSSLYRAIVEDIPYAESIEAKQAGGVVTVDMAEMPDDTTAEEFITQRVEQAKLGFIDFHQTPPEWVTTKVGDVDTSHLDVPSVGVTPIEEDYIWSNVNDLAEYEVSLDVNGKVIDTKEVTPHVSLPRTKKKKHRR